MSYCVNCGVELETTIEKCPLCNTPVVNPRAENTRGKMTPFPKEKGQVEVVKRKDLAILLSVVLISTGLTCLVLNCLVFDKNWWSFLIIGVCAIIWVFAIPAVIFTRLPIYVSLLLDGLVVALFLWLITFMTNESRWFWELGMPITAVVTVAALIIVFLVKNVSRALLSMALYLISEAAVLCVIIEILIEIYFSTAIVLTWSAVVLAVCVIIDICLITILSRKRLRNTVRQRLHF